MNNSMTSTITTTPTTTTSNLNKNSNSFKVLLNTNNQMKKRYPNLYYYFPTTCDSLVKKVCSWVTIKNNQQVQQKNTCRGGSNSRNSEKKLSIENMESGVWEILETILTFITEDLKESEYLFLVTLYFSDMYVKKTGVRQSQILWLILISCILSFKMYSDDFSKFPIKKINSRFSIDIKDNIIGKMEIQFLSNIGYNLYIDESSITSFISCLFIDYEINCQNNLEMIQTCFSQIQKLINTTSD